MENVDLENVPPDDYKSRFRISTILYLCQHFIKNPTSFDEIMLLYGFECKDWKIARNDLRDHIKEKLGDGVDVTKYNKELYAKKTWIKDIKELFELLTPTGGTGYVYVPNPKDSDIVIDSSPAKRQLLQLKSDLVSLTEKVNTLIVASDTKQCENISINVPTTNSFASLVKNTDSLNVPASRTVLSRTRKRSLAESHRDASTSRSKVVVKNVGSGGTIGNMVSSAPKFKRAVKVTCYKEITKADIENWCKTKSETLKKHGDYNVELLRENRYNCSYRITCDNWPSNAGMFDDGCNWPTGMDVVKWTGPIRPLSSSKAHLLYVGRMDSDTTVTEMESELKSLYTDKNDVKITVFKQPKNDRFGNSAFVVKIASDSDSSSELPEDLVTDYMKSLHAYVRKWVGAFPRKTSEQGLKRVKIGSKTNNAMQESS